MLLLTLSAGCARKNFFASTPLVDAAVRTQLQQSPEAVDSVTVKAGKHYSRGFLHRILWGTHYRPVWNAPVTAPVLDLNTAHGGLTVKEIGGGFQTTSMTLADSSAFTYALRSLDKDPIRVLPKVWRKTFAANVLRDQISAINPYAALTAPPMAAAAGIMHSTPRLVYVRPNDSAFGEHKERFGDKVYLLEEKFDGDKTITAQMGKAVDIDGSGTVLNNRYGDNDVFIDQVAFAKARLFDILIHDWDRHEGQWEWAQYNENGIRIYRPIPKDRDNMYYRFQDGIIPWIFSRNWAIRKFESFDDEFNDVYALTMNSRFIDERGLSALTRQQFDSLAHVLQKQITDQVIAEAVQQFPSSVYELVGPATQRKLISRRDALPKAAEEFYKILAKEVLVVGTDVEDTFEVKRLNDEETEVTVRRKSDDIITYHRVFFRSETELITLHGLAGDDDFKVTGKAGKGIKVKIVGGRGEDEITDTSKVGGWGKKTWVYDTERGTELKAGPETKDKRTSDVRVHAFDREGF
ncbi:hypothetical protein MKJ04_16595 [Pontibacter sp. E15-1]|uniref:hypothetical protein n=1 Tax=Pontibacter sp. E15-1 TaxID=2919918 RepID=UPI001F502DBF|nr:hypothetical protein [Pontibacter sp. E15-1]MCJ8166466.1 hypothetical protein [Pontibacter sp. E15-1]